MTDDIPGMYAPAPFPCNTALLVAWLNRHYGFALPAETTFHRRPHDERPGVVGAIQMRYGKAIPAKDEAKGLYPSDAWTFVLAEEKRIRGGQKALF